MSSTITEKSTRQWLQPALVEESPERYEAFHRAIMSASQDLEGRELAATLAAFGTVSDEVTVWMGGHISQSDPSFSMDDGEKLVGIMSGAALVLRAFEDDSDESVAGGLAFKSATFLNLRPVDGHFPELMDKRLKEMALQKRSRPDLTTIDLGSKLSLPSIRKPEEGHSVDPSELSKDIGLQSQAIRRLTTNAKNMFVSFKSALDAQDEEIEILWWHLGGRTDTGVLWSDLSKETRILLSAQEMRDRTREIPGPAAAAHLLRPIFEKPKSGKVSLLDIAKEAQQSGFTPGVEVGGHELLPLLTTLEVQSEFDSETDSDTWQKVAKNKFRIDVKAKYDADELAIQLYRELQLAEVVQRTVNG